MSDELALLITLLDEGTRTTFFVALKTKTSELGSQAWVYWAEPENRETIARMIGYQPNQIIKVERIAEIVVTEK